MMHIVEITTHGTPEVLRVGQRLVPQAGEGELLIRVSASGVNRPDVLQRMGHYPVPAGASDVPGLEVAGVIESGDAAALAEAGLKVGDRVCALVAGGAVLGSAAEALCGIRQAQGSKAARVIARVRQPGPDGARGKCGTCEERTDDGTLCCWSAFVVDGMVLSLK